MDLETSVPPSVKRIKMQESHESSRRISSPQDEQLDLLHLPWHVCFDSAQIHLVAFCPTFLFLDWGASVWMKYSQCGLKWPEGQGHLPEPLHITLTSTDKDAVDLPCSKGAAISCSAVLLLKHQILFCGSAFRTGSSQPEGPVWENRVKGSH